MVPLIEFSLNLIESGTEHTILNRERISIEVVRKIVSFILFN